jgi:hypothetical protein
MRLPSTARRLGDPGVHSGNMSGLVEILSSQLPPLLGLRTDSPIGKEGVALSAGPPPLPSSHRCGRSRPGYSKLRLTAADMVGNRDRYRFLPLGHALDVCRWDYASKWCCYESRSPAIISSSTIEFGIEIWWCGSNVVYIVLYESFAKRDSRIRVRPRLVFPSGRNQARN